MLKENNGTDIDSKFVEEKAHDFMKALGLDMSDPNLKGTPERLVKMYTQELFKGLYYPRPEVAKFPNNGKGFFYTKIPFRSTCAHHFQPVKGVAHIFVDYNGCKDVIGLSKFNRIVDWLSSKPTLQEDLSRTVLEEFVDILGTDKVGVILRGEHSCVTDRGTCAAFSDTITENFGTEDREFKMVCRNYLSI